MKKIIKIILVFILLCWVIGKIRDNYENGEKKPFWKRFETVQVCKKPYYSSGDCYKLQVTLIDNKNARINFQNGGYIDTHDITCYFAAKLYNSPRYVFCRSWDTEGNQWDFLPQWVNY